MPRTAPLALLALLVLPALQLVPSARADQVPPGSGAYYHVGDNLWAGGMPSHAAAVDGNETSGYAVASGSGNSWPVCTIASNVTVPLPSVAADMLHLVVGITVSGTNGGEGCLSFGVTLANGGAPSLMPLTEAPCQQCTTKYAVWTNATYPANVTGVWVASSQRCSPCGSYSRTAYLYEAEAFQKNATTSDPVRALANQAAANLQCYATGNAASNFASSSYAAPQGTFYVMVPSVMPASFGSPPNPMQIYTTFSGLTATFNGWSRVVPDVSGARNAAVAVWRVTTTQPGIPFFIKPAGSGNINATDTVCHFSRVGAMQSSTYANGYVFAPLTAWGGSASDLWGVVYDANGYPVNSVYDADLSGAGPLFKQDNMTFGAQVFPAGTAGQKATLSLATLPYAWAGNGILVALGQSTAAQGDSTTFGLQVNGRPAQAIMSGQSATNGFEYAIFYIDNIAARNNLSNANGTVGQSAHRPLAAESYELTLGSGFDPAAPVYYGNTYGRDGHAGLSCRTVCGSNLLVENFVLPGQQTNTIRFHVEDPDGNAIPDVRVMHTNASLARLTNAAGDAWFNDTFTDAAFTLTKTGYVTLCAEYYFRNAPGSSSGQAASGCPYVRALNATFNVVMLTLQQAGLGSSGSVGVGGGPNAPITFTFTGNTTRYIPDRVEVNITRSRQAAHFVGLDRIEPTQGFFQHNILRPIYWQADQSNVFQFYYPPRAKSTSQDMGLYVIWVMNETGIILAHQKFFILGAGQSTSQYDVLITSDMIRSMESAGYISAAQSFQLVFQANLLAAERSVRDEMYANFQKVNEYGWFAVGFLLFLAAVRAIRR